MASSKFESILYADDTTLVNSLCSFTFSSQSRSTHNVSDSINLELNKVYDWLAANKLSLNISKTKYMIFHYPQRKLVFDLHLKIDDIPISKTDEFNYLGLLVDKHLNWNAHINKIGNKLSKVIGILKRLNKYIPLKGLVIIYNSLFLPHLNYSSLVWGFNCDRILSLQKKVVRVICRAKYKQSTA